MTRATLLQMLPTGSDSDLQNPFFLRSFLYRLCYDFLVQTESRPAQKDMDTNTTHQILSYLNDHYTQEITLSSLAREFGLNSHYISTLISKTTHQNFREFLNSYRIEKAKKLLETTGLSITEIAYRCGFNTLRTFNRAFISFVGMTPSQYRIHQPLPLV